jgi:hypothetical protein
MTEGLRTGPRGRSLAARGANWSTTARREAGSSAPRDIGDAARQALLGRSLGEVSVLQLQQSVGNQAVRRIIQRKLYNRNLAWADVKSKTAQIDQDIDTQLRAFNVAYIKGTYFDIRNVLDKLEALVQQRLGTTADNKKKRMLTDIQQDITDERAKLVAPMTEQEIVAYLEKHEAHNWYLTSEKKISKELKELRIRLMTNELLHVTRPTVNDIESKANQAAGKGTLEGYWVGRGLCDVAVQERRNGGSREFQPKGDIRWNHFIGVLSKDSWDDPTYRQFFTSSDWAVGPPIFTGNAADFKSLGLDEERTQSYLAFIGKSGTKKKTDT